MLIFLSILKLKKSSFASEGLLTAKPHLSAEKFIGIKYTSNGKGTVRVGDGTSTMNNAISLCPASLIVPDQIVDNGEILKVTEIGPWAFYNCDSLVSVSIGANVKIIGEYAFSDCDYLSSITFEKGSSLEVIENRAFSWCSVESLEIPSSVKSIGENAFNSRGKLSTVVYCGSNFINNKVFCKDPPKVYVTSNYKHGVFGGVKVVVSDNVCKIN